MPDDGQVDAMTHGYIEKSIHLPSELGLEHSFVGGTPPQARHRGQARWSR
jgi:hypothetical protein